MLKFSILLNSSVTFLVLIINFLFKIYLAREFSKNNLIIYYTIVDVFSLIGRFFIGYKDALTTLYNQSSNKLKILRIFTGFFIFIVLIISLIFLPLISKHYLPKKIENYSLSWEYLSLLFVSMNLVSFYSYIFLVTKFYKLISFQEILKVISWIGFILFFSQIIDMPSDYKTLICASISTNFLIILFFIYFQKSCLPDYNFLNLIHFKNIHWLILRDKIIKQFFKLTMLASLNYFIYGLLLFAPVYTMLNSGNIKDLGNYQVVARSIYFALVSVFSWPLGRFMFPEFSDLIAKKRYQDLNAIQIKFIKLLFIFGIVVVFSCWILSKIVISYIFPKEYIESYKMLNILIVALPFVMYQNFSESIIKAIGDYKMNLIIKLSGIIFFGFSYFILNIFKIKFASIYAFAIGVFSIFMFSLYYELRIKKEWYK